MKGNWWKVIWRLTIISILGFLAMLPIILISGKIPLTYEILTNTLTDIIGSFITVGYTVLFLNFDYIKKQNYQDISINELSKQEFTLE